ncbi:hypothetical protein [Chryseobacterium sp. BIGb0232]|uniref:hypothetical protein n=1 Tax=Chryseobacterium sp. BIGb0232 TaxID=2940598 RepID=UPI000F46567F|nr:hypothetical protein [Chryseobacterium sp. BIGb0232]MCS4301123.1 hypothetical protein [Chryseobacterium sp. BIGb0232]ROS20016.1 hypothetical protein EDF65_0717 [Chryseobacterium nakagawai]
MEISVFDENKYIYSIIDVDDKFVLVNNLYHHDKYRIIVTDFKGYIRSIDLDDWENIIAVNSIRFLQKLDGNRIFINSMSEETINFLKSENINVVAPPDMFRLHLQRRIDQKKLKYDDNHLREYLIQTLWIYGEYFVSFQQKWQCRNITQNTYTGNDQLKIVLHSYTGETVKEILIQDITNGENIEIPYLHNYVCCENIFSGKINDRLFVVDIKKGSITKFLLKNDHYIIQDINALGEVILSFRRNLIVLKSTDNGIEVLLNTEYKGFIKAARFNHSNDLVIFSSRKIRSFKKHDLQPLRDLDTHKIYLNKTLIMNDGRMLLCYSAYNKYRKEYSTKTKVIEI